MHVPLENEWRRIDTVSKSCSLGLRLEQGVHDLLRQWSYTVARVFDDFRGPVRYFLPWWQSEPEDLRDETLECDRSCEANKWFPCFVRNDIWRPDADCQRLLGQCASIWTKLSSQSWDWASWQVVDHGCQSWRGDGQFLVIPERHYWRVRPIQKTGPQKNIGRNFGRLCRLGCWNHRTRILVALHIQWW